MITPSPPYRALLHDSLIRAAKVAPDRPALIAGDEVCTYAAFDRSTNRLAAALQARGLKRGDRVAIFMDNTVACAISIFGVLKAGGVFVVINPQTKEDKVCFIANDCTIVHLITDIHLKGVASAVLGTVPSLTHILVSGTGSLESLSGSGVRTEWLNELMTEEGDEVAPAGTIPSDLAALIYTSGSTGNPKGVMQTHQSMVFAVGSLGEYQGLQRQDVLLCVLPMAFDYGLYQLLLAVSVAASLVIERSFTYPAEVFAQMTKHEVTTFPGVPTIYSMLIGAHRRKPLSFPRVRRVTNTAAALPPAHIATLREIFPNARIFAMYGLTECKRVSYLPPELLDEKPGSVGIAIPGTEVFLRSADGKPVPPGTPGILHVRGPHVMRGYWNNPERTSKMLYPGDIPGENVLRTGDWFRMDADGCLYFLSRSDDIIKCRGEKVSPAEVEAAIYSLEGVHEAIVIGVPDDVLGEAVRAFIVPDAGVTLDERRIRRELTGKLENFMVPRDIILRDSLPKNSNGKIDRKAMAGKES